MDTASNTPVAAAQVILLQVDHSASAITDHAGRFRISAVPGAFALQVNALGYETLRSTLFSVLKGENLSLVVLVGTQPVAIAPIYAVGRSRRPLSDVEQFKKRMKKEAFGAFFDAKKIQDMNANSLMDVLTHVPGVRIETKSGSTTVRLRFDCEPAVILDGTAIAGSGLTVDTVNPDGTPGQPVTVYAQSAAEIVASMVSAGDIAGVEVYKSAAGLPAELAQVVPGWIGSDCGVIAVWTKR